MLAFGAGPLTVGVGLGKGAWVGLWILYVIWPALLMHHLASRVGMAALGRALLHPVAAQDRERPAARLGVAVLHPRGFWVRHADRRRARPVAALGIGKARAVALPLIGYHWAVGFGSMGSSFYMGALTAHLDSAERAGYAAAAWPSCSASTACSPGCSSR